MSGPTRATLALIVGLVPGLLPGGVQGAPHLQLDVQLDPGTRVFQAEARLSDPDGLAGFALGPGFEVATLEVDGQPVAWATVDPCVTKAPALPLPTSPACGGGGGALAVGGEGPGGERTASKLVHGMTFVNIRDDGWHSLPAGARSVALRYRATLAPPAELDHRQVLSARGAVAGVEGSFLPASAGWYPDPGQRFSYAVKLALPAGQKGLVSGDLVREVEGAGGYRAEYAFPQPAEGIDLMAGPYEVTERTLTLASGAPVRLRTWFHPELAGLAQGYLADSARYLERYSRLIGDYPFGLFSVVSSPTPTGFGMPGLTYLGRDVLKLPFIRATSLGHEVLHNWWGNGVYPDWARGNWSEGLTTFLADYAYREDAGADAARDMRLGWLRDLAAVAPGADRPLAAFVSRQHGVDAIVGYGKSAMVFLMLRDRIGAEAFTGGLRRLWREKRFQTASWADLEAAFSQASGQSLGDFFRQWVARPGAPDLRLVAARQAGGALSLRFEQSGDDVLDLPVRLDYPARSEVRVVRLAGPRTETLLSVSEAVTSVAPDPDYRVWRRLNPARLPASLREVFVAPQVHLVLPEGAGQVKAAARGLAGRLLEGELKDPPTSAADATLVIGLHAAVDAWLAARGWPPRPSNLAGRGSAQVWVDRDGAGRPYGVVSGRDADALQALQRGLPHHGRQGWLVFEGGRASDRGAWPPRPDTVMVTR